MSSIIRDTAAALGEIYAELAAMEPLTPAGQPSRTPEEHAAWMAKHQSILDLMHKAEIEARAALPHEVAMALWHVNQRALELFGTVPERTKESEEPNA
jgi:hypothetical protein